MSIKDKRARLRQERDGEQGESVGPRAKIVAAKKPRRLSTELLKLSALYAALYLALSPAVSMPLYNLMLFPADRRVYDVAVPIKKMYDALKVTTEDVYFSAPDGNRLHAWFLRKPGASKVVLVSHGNGGNIARGFLLYASLALCNASVFAYDYEGYGISPGSPSVKNVIDDGLAAYDCLTQQLKVSPEQIVVYGESLGTGVTCQISTKRKVAGIILQSGFPTLMSAAHDNLFWLRLYPNSWFADMDNIEVLQKQHPPLLIVHGVDDTVLSYAGDVRLFQAAVQPKRMLGLKGFGHTLRQFDRPEYNSAVRQFLSSLP